MVGLSDYIDSKKNINLFDTSSTRGRRETQCVVKFVEFDRQQERSMFYSSTIRPMKWKLGISHYCIVGQLLACGIFLNNGIPNY